MIVFQTTAPKALLDQFSKAVKDGDITTWEKDSDGDFFHKASQWTKRAWLRPEVDAGEALKFAIVFRKDESEQRLVYAFHASKIVETFINHFSVKFSIANVTPNKSGKDSSF